MLSIQSISLHIGSNSLLENASLTVYPGQKVGLIGKNGAGKSTLFRAVLGELSVDQGKIEIPANWRVGYVEQEIKNTDQSALNYVLEGDSEYAEIQLRIQNAENSDCSDQLVSAYDELDKTGGYLVPQKAKQLMYGLGFSEENFDHEVRAFSGGWQVRLKLARALMQKSDLLLLDEPTNHLDIEAVSWLTQWLNGYNGAVITISHDRHFLDQVVEAVTEISDGKLHLYSGNFAAYERQKNERLMQQHALFEKQKQQMQHLKTFIERFKAKASKAKQAQSRVKALQRIEAVSALQATNPFHFNFPVHDFVPDPMVQCENLAFGYENKLILGNVALTVRAGDRIGLVGVNGSGKSTLLKLFVKDLKPQAGKVIYAKGIKVGYFAQHQLESLQLNQSPLQHLLNLSKELDENLEQLTDQQARDFLGQFGFAQEKALRQVELLSGGEKARLSLALMVFQKPNLVILDEPTNHLDIETRDALDLALQEFNGALLLVTHDQHLLSSLVDQYWWVHNQKVTHFHGTLEEYLNQRLTFIKEHQKILNHENGGDNKQGISTDASNGNRKAQRQQNAELRKRISHATKAQTNALNDLEKVLSKKQKRLDEIHMLLEDSSLYDSGQSALLTDLLKEESLIKKEIEGLEDKWLLLEEEIESITEACLIE